MDDSSLNNWFALQVRTQLASLAASSLEGKGYEVFLPTYQRKRKWSDRFKIIDEPLFPGYLFCRLDPLDRLLPILTTPGVLSIVAAGRIPIAVPDQEIESIKALVHSGLPVSPFAALGKGARVMIERGPLAGVEGVIETNGKSCRLIVSVELLGRSVMVEIDRDWARPVQASTSHGDSDRIAMLIPRKMVSA